MGVKTIELSAAEQQASLAAAQTEAVKVSHYGTGKHSTSPVLLHLPSTLGYHYPIPVPQLFADEFRWLYENGFAAAAELSTWHGRIANNYSQGRFDRAEELIADARGHWRRVTPIPSFTYPGFASAEEEYLDTIGCIAIFADAFDSRGESYNGVFPTHWGHRIRVPKTRRALTRVSLVGVLLGALVATVLNTQEWEALLFSPLALIPWRTRFEYSTIERLSILKWASLRHLPDPGDTEDESEKKRWGALRQAHAEAILGADDIFAFDRACDVLRTEIVDHWAERARARVEKEAEPLLAAREKAEAALRAADPARGAGSMLGRALDGDAPTIRDTPGHGLLEASQALLAEFAARDADENLSAYAELKKLE